MQDSTPEIEVQFEVQPTISYTKKPSPRAGNSLSVRLGAEEREVVNAAARRMHLTTSSWARSVLVRVAKLGDDSSFDLGDSNANA
jgi:hypothetical protein